MDSGTLNHLANADSLTPINIGWIAPLSGNAAVLGVDRVPAINMVFDAVIKSFLAVKNYQGLSGSITMDPDGITRSFKVGMYVYKSGSFEVQ